MVAKFEQEKGHELGMKRTRKKKGLRRKQPNPKPLKVLMTTSTHLKRGRMFRKKN
jgi:hypothetical protein